ncbi:HAMP domain-containing sensor histidine kinase [Atopobiaceae bacterium 24-176]
MRAEEAGATGKLRRRLTVTLVGELLSVAAAFFIGFFVLCLTGTQSLLSPSDGWWRVQELPLVASPERAPTSWERGLRLYLDDEKTAADTRPQLVRADNELVLYQIMPHNDGSSPSARCVLVTGPCTALALVCAEAFVVAALIAVTRYRQEVSAMETLETRGDRAQEYFGNAAHELKAPLMAIDSWSEAARCGLVIPNDAFASINKETGRMGTLVDQMLKLARADAGKLRPVPCRADLRELLYDAEQALAPAAAERGVELLIHGPRPVVCEFDLELTYAIILNALTNALRHGERRVWLGCSASGGTTRFWAVNDGDSISDEDLALVFERFGKGTGGSTGIGMALALQCAKAQGFSLVVGAVPKGTLTLLEIPSVTQSLAPAPPCA